MKTLNEVFAKHLEQESPPNFVLAMYKGKQVTLWVDKLDLYDKLYSFSAIYVEPDLKKDYSLPVLERKIANV